MRVLPLTQETFDSAVIRSTCLVVEFSNHYQDFADRVQEVIRANEVEWAHVQTRTEPRVTTSFGIEADVALLIFREQIVLYLENGRHDSARIADLVRRIRALDMPAIKAEIAVQKQGEMALGMRRVCPTALRGPMFHPR